VCRGIFEASANTDIVKLPAPHDGIDNVEVATPFADNVRLEGENDSIGH
jgi:hypothetical protein